MTYPTRILPAHIEDTVRAIAELHAEHHRQATAIEANALAVPADPQAVLEAIKDTHEELIGAVDETPQP